MKKIGFLLAIAVLFSVTNMNNAFGWSNQTGRGHEASILVSELFSRKELRAIKKEAETTLPRVSGVYFTVESNGIGVIILMAYPKTSIERYTFLISLDGRFGKPNSTDIIFLNFIKRVQEILDKTDS